MTAYENSMMFNEKQQFTQQLETVLKTAMPNIRRVEFFTGELYDKELNNWNKPDYTPEYIADDEFVAITMNNGYDYIVNVTGNSPMGILADVVEKMKYK